MSWSSALRKSPAQAIFSRPEIAAEDIDWSRLVSLDFETYYDDDYTLRKLSTSEYVRDPRFEALMCGIKVGNRVTRVVPGPQIAAELRKIPWETHSLLCHHVQFDGLILSHHYKVRPKRLYCSLSMARMLHGSEIGAGLDEVSRFYGGAGKTESGTADFKGFSYKDLRKDELRYRRAATYCANDVDEMLRIFKAMLGRAPASEMDLIDVVCRMFTDPVLRLDEPRCRAEYERELERKRQMFLRLAADAEHLKLDSARKKKLGENPSDEAIAVAKAKKLIGSDAFADLLRAEGIEPPTKLSPSALKRGEAVRTWAFAKTDLEFTALQEHPSERVRDLVDARLTVKSAGIETRAARMLKLGAGGQAMPVYYKVAAAHTLRLGGGDKCLTGDTKILVRRAQTTKEIELKQLQSTDLVWDSEEFVSHGGLVCRGERSVITYQGVTATPDHKVFVVGRKRPVQMQRAAEQTLSLQPSITLVEWSRLRRTCQVAKDRCTNSRNRAYKNYGSRGITFDFTSASVMAEWILKNLGARPSPAHSLDREENEKGYAPGNLRWATVAQQASNKRQYVSWRYGERLKRLGELKPEFSYERLRDFVKQGLTDEQILARKRTTSGRPRVRHPELWSTPQIRR